MTPGEITRQEMLDVCREHGISLQEAVGRSRRKPVLRCRDAMIRRLREKRKLTTTQIGTLVNRNHSSVSISLQRTAPSPQRDMTYNEISL